MLTYRQDGEKKKGDVMKIRIECASAYIYESKMAEILEEKYGEKLKPYNFKVNRKQKSCSVNVTSLKQLFELVKECDDIILKYDEESGMPRIIIYDDVIY